MRILTSRIERALILSAAGAMIIGCVMTQPATTHGRTGSAGKMGQLDKNIPELAVASGKLNTLVTAVKATDLLGALSGKGPFTVFAPTDNAFAKLPAGTLKTLLDEPGRVTLKRILLNHVVADRYEAGDLLEMKSVKTLAGTRLNIIKAGSNILVGQIADPDNRALVIGANLGASNGVVHLIDSVLIPADSHEDQANSTLKKYLRKTVQRGAMLFNKGNHEGCAYVYETALEGIYMSEGWGLSENQKENLQTRMIKTSHMPSVTKRAWGYRKIIDDLAK